MHYAYPTGIACAIAEVDRMDFYNAQKRGYPPASLAELPYRVFNEPDLIALCTFGRFRKAGFAVKGACEVASLILQQLQAKPRLKTLVIGWDFDGKAVVLSNTCLPGTAFQLVLNISEIRERILQRAIEWNELEARA